MYAFSMGFRMGALLWWMGTCVHHSKSRFSWQVIRTVPVRLYADFATSCSSRRKDLTIGMAKCKSCALPAKEARAFTLTQRLWKAAMHITPVARHAMLLSFKVGARNSPFLKSRVIPRWSPTSTSRKLPLVGCTFSPRLASRAKVVVARAKVMS